MANERGATLLEAMLAIAIMTAVGLAALGLLQRVMLVTFKAREQMTCSRMAQTGFARIKNIDFYDVFAVDSSSGNFGLWAAYPYMSTLSGIKTTLAASKFDRFKVGIVFMRRDTTDSNHDGFTTDLVPFTDANGDGVDDYDPNIKYFDQNGDGDFYDAYVSNGRTVAEQPDTHIKQVTFSVYRRGRLVCSQTDLISLEQFMPSSNPSSEASLSLSISTPANSAFLYSQATAGLAASRALALAKPYPASIQQVRADSSSPLVAAVETSPLASVNLYVGNSGVLDALVADSAGFAAQTAPGTTLALVEGENELTAQAVKGAYSSPLAKVAVIYDKAPPVITGMTPAGTTATLAPHVAASVADLGVATTSVSGICPDVITMKVNGSTVPFAYDSTTGLVVWVSSATGSAPEIAAGAYTAYVEVGDYAGFKSTQSWTFTAAISDPDNSAPAVSNKSPIGGSAASDLPVVSVRVQDNQSGIVPSSLSLSVDGVIVVGPAELGSAYDPATGTISYTPPAAFSPGSTHTVQVSARHFATSPADKVTTVDSWSFTVP